MRRNITKTFHVYFACDPLNPVGFIASSYADCVHRGIEYINSEKLDTTIKKIVEI